MKIEKQMVIAFAVIGVIGGASIFTLPLRSSEPMPESGLTTEPCTLDLEVARVEEEIESRKAVLDSMLESAVMVREAQVVETATETEQVTTGEPESETEEECTTEEETTVFEPITEAPVEIFQPVDSLMAPDLQAWTYAHCTEAGVDPYIVMAVCERESCCISNIMGDGGRAYGMMQIHPVWVMDKLSAHGYSTDDLLMAQPNITIGVEILQGYIEQGHGIEWALMAYNGGPSMAGTPATQEYAAWVITRADELRR